MVFAMLYLANEWPVKPPKYLDKLQYIYIGAYVARSQTGCKGRPPHIKWVNRNVVDVLLGL